MQKNCYILMADICESRTYGADNLMQSFKSFVRSMNEKCAGDLLVNLSISLGDECQAMFSSPQAAVRSIIKMEEELIRIGIGFKLRYVLQYGLIESSLENKVSYEMLGQGLIDAREELQNLKQKKRLRYRFNLKLKRDSDFMTHLFFNMQSIVDNWKLKDYALIKSFLELTDYKAVAADLGKDVSLVWRREKSLKIREYNSLKELASIYLEG